MKGVIAALTKTPARRTALALAALVVLVLVPFAGNYGAWDPWETHYGEVARQMLARNDFISLWWPGSPIDHPPLGQFWSKPVLTFWLEAMSMKLFGLEWAHARPDELVTSFRAEWALRLPSLLLSMCTLAALYAFVRRLAGRRAAALTVVITLTSPTWLLISRQAMTDMPFVAPMTIALCLAGLALLAPDDAELPRRRWRRFSWPHAGAFYGFVALFVGTTLPQLIIDGVQLRAVVRTAGWRIVLPGIVPMLPYCVCFVLGLWWAARAKSRRQLYLLSAWVLLALAMLAKGPAGLGLPVLVVGFYLVVAGRWRDILKLELIGGGLCFVACGFPWYHAMLIRHGRGFWNEFIGDNYVHRAEGRHGDRGTFEYYWHWLGYGMFPWSGLAAAGGLAAFMRGKTPRQALARFALVWLLVDMTTITLVATKFHHYLLPALPAAAILGALFIDDVLTSPARWQALICGLVAVPLTFVCGRDLAAYPPRFLWMFDYDYVLVPGTGRPWPSTAVYGTRYEYGGLLWVLTLFATVAVALFTVAAARRQAVADEDGRAPSDKRVWALAGAVVAALVVGIAVAPWTSGPPPSAPPWLWLIPAAFMLGALVLVAATTRAGGAWVLAAVALVVSAFLGDRYLPDLGPHWSQKHVIAAYYANRHGPDEPLIVWNLYWRGENFYTRNEVYDQSQPPNERWAWTDVSNRMGPRSWFEKHKGTRVFFLVERTKLEQLRAVLPPASKNLRIVDGSNNKLLLVETRI